MLGEANERYAASGTRDSDSDRNDPRLVAQVSRGFLSLGLVLCAFFQAQRAEAASQWTVDPTTSRLGFVSAYAGEPVQGQFKRWNAQIEFAPENLRASRFRVVVELASVATGVGEQDGALLTEDWFYATAFPQAIFEASEFQALGGDRYKATGSLSLRGVSRRIEVPFTATTSGTRGQMRGAFDLNRSAFGVGSGDWSSGDTVPVDVKVEFSVNAAIAGAAAAPSAPEADPALEDIQRIITTSAADDYRPQPAFPEQTRAPPPRQPSRYRTEVVTAALEQPWALAFLPDGRMLVTEFAGRMRIVTARGQVSQPLGNVPAVKGFIAGLHDVVLDPDFARNRVLYFTYFAPLEHDTPPTLETYIKWLKLPVGEHEKHPYGYERLARARLSKDDRRLQDVRVILQGAHRRIVVARDGKLLVTATPPAGAGIPVDSEPQRLDNLYGKVVRIGRDGRVPADNPFVGRPGVRPEIFAYGLRDMEGAALHPVTGELWTSENGPRGGDEINIVRAGQNYGFPLISYGREYSGKLINGGRAAQEGLQQPVYFWTPSIAPSGLAFYTGTLFPEWRNNLFAGALKGKRLIRLVLERDRVVAEESLLAERGKRIRDVRQGPDGALYVLTDEEQGELLRLVPDRDSAIQLGK